MNKIYAEEKISKEKHYEQLGEKTRSVNNLMGRLQETNNLYQRKLESEIERGKKINENLDLIVQKIDKYNNTKDKETNTNSFLTPKFKEVSSLGKFLDRSEMEAGTGSKTKLGMKLDLLLFEGTNKGIYCYNISNYFIS